jgi:hypothetical protein
MVRGPGPGTAFVMLSILCKLVQSVWVDRKPLISHHYFLANAAYAFTQAQPDAAVEVLRKL